MDLRAASKLTRLPHPQKSRRSPDARRDGHPPAVGWPLRQSLQVIGNWWLCTDLPLLRTQVEPALKTSSKWTPKSSLGQNCRLSATHAIQEYILRSILRRDLQVTIKSTLNYRVIFSRCHAKRRHILMISYMSKRHEKMVRGNNEA